MKNIKVPKRVGNALAKQGYLRLIDDSIRKICFSGQSHIEMGGYENDADRVHFTYAGKRCELYGVWIPDYQDVTKPSKLPMTVFCQEPGWKHLWDISVDVRDLRFKTLDRIAYEVYDYCKSADDPDYEEARTEYIAGEMDNYREFMS